MKMLVTEMPTRPASQPPTKAPTMPTTTSQMRPMPLPLSTLLARKPAIPPTMIQMTMFVNDKSLYLRYRLAAVIWTGCRGVLQFVSGHHGQVVAHLVGVLREPLHLVAL